MKKWVFFVSGFLVAAVLFSVPVMTDGFTGTKSVTAKYSNIKMVVNSKLVTASEEPFLLNGRTYVPLRVVAEALGSNVGWENSTVLVGSGKQSLLLHQLVSPSATGLDCSADAGAGMQCSGKAYDRGFYATAGKGRANESLKFFVQNLGMKKITGSIALDDSNPDGISPVEVEIIRDKETVWEGTLTKGEAPKPIAITIPSDANNIYFNFSGLENTKIDFINIVAQY